MGQYYFAVSSLPQLYYDSESHPSAEEFLTLCAENLSKADLRAVVTTGSGDQKLHGSAMMKKWLEWNMSLRADLAVLRAQQFGWNVEEYQEIERVSGTEELAREAFNAESPLLAEEMLERGRWAVLEELEVGHYFDLQKLLVYRLKISILDRKSMFEAEAGMDNFKRIYSVVAAGNYGGEPE